RARTATSAPRDSRAGRKRIVRHKASGLPSSIVQPLRNRRYERKLRKPCRRLRNRAGGSRWKLLQTPAQFHDPWMVLAESFHEHPDCVLVMGSRCPGSSLQITKLAHAAFQQAAAEVVDW